MPCYRCGTRQVDPDRGESPWRRGVRADRQVLICPGCQSSFDWLAELDGCPVCASAHLVRRLGEIECRDCGYVRAPAGPTGSADRADSVVGGLAGGSDPALPGSTGPGVLSGGLAADDIDPTPGLAEEVERALARVLGRAGRTAGIG